MSLGKTSVIALCMALYATPLLAQSSSSPNRFQGTSAEQNACQRDAVRFCRDAVPDTFRVLACLQTNRKKISKACRAVLAAHGQ